MRPTGEKFTLWARLSSMWGAGLATFCVAVIGLMGNEIWQDYKTFRTDRVKFEDTTVSTLLEIHKYIATSSERALLDLREVTELKGDLRGAHETLKNHEGRIIRLETIELRNK